MPFINGKRVTNAEFIRHNSGEAVGWRDAFGYADGSPAEQAPEPVEEPRTPRRRGSRKKAAEAALNAVTGLDITLDGEDQEKE